MVERDLVRYAVYCLGSFCGYIYAPNPAWAKRLAARRWTWSRSFSVVEA